VRIIDFNSGFVFCKRPLDFIGDSSINGDGIFTLTETDDGEVTGSKFNAVLLIDEVENRTRDFDKNLFSSFRRCRRRSGVDTGGGGVREEIFNEVVEIVVD